MGEDKAGLLWRGERFLDLAMRRLEALVGAERVWASGEGRGEKCVPDRKPGLGPLGGLHAVCERLPEGAGLLVSPVDMPLLQEEELARLRDALSRSGILAAQFEGVPLPMALRVGAQCRAALAECLNEVSGDRSLRAFLRNLRAVTLAPGTAADRLVNLNDPRELARAREAYEAHL